MGFSTPPLQFYNVNYYPLYPGGPVVNGSDRTNFNRNTSFQTASTEFSVPFGVNTVPQDRTNDNYYFSLNQNGSLTQKSLASLNASNQSYSLDSNGNVQKSNAPANAPNSPNAYQDYLKSLAISDFKIADLLNQPSFQLSNIGIGLEVTTDGFGGIDNVKLDPAIQAIADKAGAVDPSFAFLNRREALIGAIQNLSPAADIVQENTGQPPVSLNQQVKDINPFKQLDFSKLSENPLQKPATVDNPLGGNSILDRLRAVQPQTSGTKLTGAQAELTGTQPQTVATAKAGFDVRISPEIQNVIASVIQKNQANQTHVNPQVIARAVDGTIPMAPSLPAVDGLNFSANASSGKPTLGLEGFETATEKKSSGGYIPFQLGQGGAQGFTQGFEGGNMFAQQQFGQNAGGDQNQGQQQNPFADNQKQQDLLYKPLQFFA